MRALSALFCTFLLVSCGSGPQPEQPKKKAEAPRPPDQTRYMPMENMVDSKVVPDHLMDKAFMPGGTLAHYKKGKAEYDMFVATLPSATDAAIALSDWRRALTDAKLVPAFGGYFGTDGGRPVFVFTKGTRVAGIAGLSEKDADLPARTFASKLP